MRGKNTIRFTDLFIDTVNTHGAIWAFNHYSKRMPMWEVLFWFKATSADLNVDAIRYLA
jgi:hypothetical protein